MLLPSSSGEIPTTFLASRATRQIRKLRQRIEKWRSSMSILVFRLTIFTFCGFFLRVKSVVENLNDYLAVGFWGSCDFFYGLTF